MAAHDSGITASLCDSTCFVTTGNGTSCVYFGLISLTNLPARTASVTESRWAAGRFPFVALLHRFWIASTHVELAPLHTPSALIATFYVVSTDDVIRSECLVVRKPSAVHQGSEDADVRQQPGRSRFHAPEWVYFENLKHFLMFVCALGSLEMAV